VLLTWNNVAVAETPTSSLEVFIRKGSTSIITIGVVFAVSAGDDLSSRYTKERERGYKDEKESVTLASGRSASVGRPADSITKGGCCT